MHEHGEGEEGLRKALKEFHDQFRQKCAVAFVACSPPCQHPGGYNVALLAGQGAEDAAEVARQAAASGVAAGAREVEAKAGRACTLPAEVAAFVSLIHSEKMMQEQLREANIDLEKMPLGSISDKQVRLTALGAARPHRRAHSHTLSRPLTHTRTPPHTRPRRYKLGTRYYATSPSVLPRRCPTSGSRPSC